MSWKKNTTSIDKSLHYDSSFDKGFEYICDVDINSSDVVSEITEELITLYDGRLGSPRRTDANQHTFGLYLPINILTPQVFTTLVELPAFNLSDYNNRKMEKIQRELHVLLV